MATKYSQGTRRFNGDKFTLFSRAYSKDAADKQAKNLREKHHRLARVVKRGRGVYDVYVDAKWMEKY